MRRLALLLPILFAAPCQAGLVTWSSTDFESSGYFEVPHSGTPVPFAGPAVVTLSYETTGPIDLTVTIAPAGLSLSGEDDNGTVSWNGSVLSATVNNGNQFIAAFIPGVLSASAGTLPTDLTGLEATGANVTGSSIDPAWQAQAQGLPEPSSMALLAIGLVVCKILQIWRSPQ